MLVEYIYLDQKNSCRNSDIRLMQRKKVMSIPMLLFAKRDVSVKMDTVTPWALLVMIERMMYF